MNLGVGEETNERILQDVKAKLEVREVVWPCKKTSSHE